jgi:hypothetical protein
MRASAIAAATAVLVSAGAMACGSKADGPQAPPPREAPKPPEPQIPTGPVPVTLPSIPATAARKVAAAATFVTIDADGILKVGRLAPGPTPYAGELPTSQRPLKSFLYPADTLDDPPPPEEEDADLEPPVGADPQPGVATAGVLGSTTLTQGGAFASLTGSGDLLGPLDVELVAVREAIGVVDAVVLADARSRAWFAAETIAELAAEHRVVLAVQGATAPEATQYRFRGPAGAPSTQPTTALQFRDDTGAVTLKVTSRRGDVDLAATGAGFTPAAIAAAIKRDPLEPDVGPVALHLLPDITVDQLAQVLAALASVNVVEVRITMPSAYGFGAAGGTGWGTIGTGRYGTLGHGSGTGGYGLGGRRGDKSPKVNIGQPNATGELDKAIIRRYIKRNLNRVLYCYEKALLAKPGLIGKIEVRFTIGADGKVESSTASGFDPDIARCVADVIRAIEFPKPKSGGSVHVVYPFNFRPDGG